MFCKATRIESEQFQGFFNFNYNNIFGDLHLKNKFQLIFIYISKIEDALFKYDMNSKILFFLYFYNNKKVKK